MKLYEFYELYVIIPMLIFPIMAGIIKSILTSKSAPRSYDLPMSYTKTGHQPGAIEIGAWG